MSSKHKKRQAPIEDGRDKPDFAADWFGKEDLSGRGRKNGRQAQGDKEKQDSADSQPTVAQYLDGDLADRLRQMKASLEDEAAQKNAATTGGRKKAVSSSAATAKIAKPATKTDGNAVDKDTASFAELFDPGPEEDESFEEMLDDSKLDWRAFKD